MYVHDTDREHSNTRLTRTCWSFFRLPWMLWMTARSAGREEGKGVCVCGGGGGCSAWEEGFVTRCAGACRRPPHEHADTCGQPTIDPQPPPPPFHSIPERHLAAPFSDIPGSQVVFSRVTSSLDLVNIATCLGDALVGHTRQNGKPAAI